MYRRVTWPQVDWSGQENTIVIFYNDSAEMFSPTCRTKAWTFLLALRNCIQLTEGRPRAIQIYYMVFTSMHYRQLKLPATISKYHKFIKAPDMNSNSHRCVWSCYKSPVFVLKGWVVGHNINYTLGWQYFVITWKYSFLTHILVHWNHSYHNLWPCLWKHYFVNAYQKHCVIMCDKNICSGNIAEIPKVTECYVCQH